ncbi:MAG: DUF4388 domain-containing protein [Anaerolineaceae bacterium]
MALKGNLRDFSIAQLLNLVNLARKTGTLVIESSAESAQVTFREGKLAYARAGADDNSLASILHQNKKLSTAQYRTIQQRATQMNDKELGLLLINAGYVTQEDVLTSLQQQFTRVIRRLFTWADGFFRFDPELFPPEDKILVRMDLENLIIEGSRQLQEQEQLQQEIPSLDLALKFTDRPGANLRNVSLSVDEWRIVSYINPKNTMRQIARTTKMSEIEIRRVAYGLIQAGLVEMIRPEGSTLPPVQKAFPTTNKEEQKSLVNRLIGRIRSL